MKSTTNDPVITAEKCHACIDEKITANPPTWGASSKLPTLTDMATPTATDLKIDRLAIPRGRTLRLTFYALRPNWDEPFARSMGYSTPSSSQGRIRLQVPALLRKRACEWRPARFVQREALAAAGLQGAPVKVYFRNFFGREAWLAAYHVSVTNVQGVNQLTRLGFLRGTPKKLRGTRKRVSGDLVERALAAFERSDDSGTVKHVETRG
jgi:hypothetical protein